MESLLSRLLVVALAIPGALLSLAAAFFQVRGYV